MDLSFSFLEVLWCVLMIDMETNVKYNKFLKNGVSLFHVLHFYSTVMGNSFMVTMMSTFRRLSRYLFFHMKWVYTPGKSKRWKKLLEISSCYARGEYQGHPNHRMRPYKRRIRKEKKITIDFDWPYNRMKREVRN